jgi:cytochrome c5
MKSVHISAAVSFVFLQQICITDTALANEAGRAIYNSICSACHAPANVMVSSPKAGDSDEWEKRLGKGLEILTDNAANGFGAMPPKGGASELSREQLRQAIQYMATPQNRRAIQ